MSEWIIKLADANLTAKSSPPTRLYVTPYYWSAQQNYRDKAGLDQDAHVALLFAMAYRLTGDSKYLAKVQEFLTAWTRCTVIANQEAQLNLMYEGQRFLEAYLLVSRDWTSNPFEAWTRDVFLPVANDLRSRENNWGAWGWLGVVLSSAILDTRVDIAGFERHLRQSYNSNTGTMTHEIKRTLSGIWYSYFALAPYTRACIELCREGHDLIDLLLKPLNWLYHYCLEPEAWPFTPKPWPWSIFQNWRYPHTDKLQVPQEHGWPTNLYLAAYQAFDRTDWLEFFQPPIYWQSVNLFQYAADYDYLIDEYR